jgi:hypothetical protein
LSTRPKTCTKQESKSMFDIFQEWFDRNRCQLWWNLTEKDELKLSICLPLDKLSGDLQLSFCYQTKNEM